MNGTLKITATEHKDGIGVGTVVECRLEHVNLVDKLIMLQCVMNALNFDEHERVLGSIFLMAEPIKVDETTIDMSALRNLLDK